MNRELRPGWATSPIVLTPIGAMLRRPRPVVRATAAWQPPVGTSDAFGAGARWFGPMLLWARSLRQTDGSNHSPQRAASPHIPVEQSRTRSLESSSADLRAGASPPQPRELGSLAAVIGAAQRDPVAQRTIHAPSLGPSGARSGQQPAVNDAYQNAVGGGLRRQVLAASQLDIRQMPVAGSLSDSVPLSVAELLETQRRRIDGMRNQSLSQSSIAEGRRTSQHLLLSGLPLVVSPPVAGEPADSGSAGHSPQPTLASFSSHIPAQAAATQRPGGLQLDSEQRAGQRTLRHGFGREMSAMMDNITRVVEERIEQVSRQAIVIPPVATAPHEPTAEDVYRLSKAEQREREFRVGRS